ncbi:fibronectin type III domain-containing protein [Luedemannella flava]
MTSAAPTSAAPTTTMLPTSAAPTSAAPTSAPPSPTGSPGPSAPDAPTGVTAIAGVSSALVEWTASPGSITKYVVTAAPGPATCTTDGTACVIGGAAGTEYTYTVVAYAGNVASAPSAPSNPVTLEAPVVSPTPPATDATMTSDLSSGQTVGVGMKITVGGEGYAAYSTVDITLYSEPTLLATVVTDAQGSFRQEITIPAGATVGEHTIIASGVDAAGNPYYMKLPVTVAPAAGADR